MNKVNQAYLRFPIARRIRHWVMMLSFTLLSLRASQRFPNAGYPKPSWAFWRIQGVHFMHHTAAIVMMFGTAWHILVMGYSVFVLRDKISHAARTGCQRWSSGAALQ
ncbi:MAG: hypothetical protein IPJ47_22870 [Anaerolineales bacterium]|nr:hypothetical protein [Anaerolineales bacterium]